MGPGDRDLRRIGREHDGRRRVVRRDAPRSSAGSTTTSSARCSPTTSAPRACEFDDAAGARRRAHRPLPDHRHARRRAHAQHVPRRVGRARPRRRRRRRSSRARRCTYLEGYLWDEPDAKDAFRRAARGSRTTPATGSRSRSPTRSASTATATSSSTCVEHDVDVAVRQRGRDHARSTRSTTFDDALQQVPRPLRDRGAHPQREGLGDRDAATRCTWSTRTRSSASSTPPAPATSTPPASCTGSRTATTSAPPGGSARWRPPR